mmetsp:Transcript_27743/g.86324  ORF Transcript_27743/g.86324 Transcript_27743/m.86324 type:complete len:391 (+) Transcript_27743:129-1301(+)
MRSGRGHGVPSGLEHPSEHVHAGKLLQKPEPQRPPGRHPAELDSLDLLRQQLGVDLREASRRLARQVGGGRAGLVVIQGALVGPPREVRAEPGLHAKDVNSLPPRLAARRLGDRSHEAGVVQLPRERHPGSPDHELAPMGHLRTVHDQVPGGHVRRHHSSPHLGLAMLGHLLQALFPATRREAEAVAVDARKVVPVVVGLVQGQQAEAAAVGPGVDPVGPQGQPKADRPHVPGRRAAGVEVVVLANVDVPPGARYAIGDAVQALVRGPHPLRAQQLRGETSQRHIPVQDEVGKGATSTQPHVVGLREEAAVLVVPHPAVAEVEGLPHCVRQLRHGLGRDGPPDDDVAPLAVGGQLLLRQRARMHPHPRQSRRADAPAAAGHVEVQIGDEV